MPSNPETFYLTAADYREQTTVPTLITPLTPEEVTDLLLETMVLIDAYVGDGWILFEDDQEFIFPRSVDEDEDGDADVPRPVALATRMIADAILEERQKGVLPHQVASESSEGHSYQKHTQSIEVDQGFAVFPPSAVALLQKYRRVGGQWAVEEDVVL
jgi:hypothetical protein